MNTVDLRRKAAERGKYAPLHRWLASLPGDTWTASFAQIEEILGFGLPDSARLYPAWWSKGGGHSHALAWEAAGFRVRVRLGDETAIFTRYGENPAQDGRSRARGSVRPRIDLDRVWPALPGNPWPKGFTGSREQLYDDDGR